MQDYSSIEEKGDHWSIQIIPGPVKKMRRKTGSHEFHSGDINTYDIYTHSHVFHQEKAGYSEPPSPPGPVIRMRETERERGREKNKPSLLPLRK